MKGDLRRATNCRKSSCMLFLPFKADGIYLRYTSHGWRSPVDRGTMTAEVRRFLIWKPRARQSAYFKPISAVVVLGFHCLFCVADVPNPVVDSCLYEILEKPFPYPYDRHHWFNLLNMSFNRSVPIFMEELVSTIRAEKVCSEPRFL